MIEGSGDENSSSILSMSDVHDKLVEAEEMLVVASQRREGY